MIDKIKESYYAVRDSVRDDSKSFWERFKAPIYMGIIGIGVIMGAERSLDYVLTKHNPFKDYEPSGYASQVEEQKTVQDSRLPLKAIKIQLEISKFGHDHYLRETLPNGLYLETIYREFLDKGGNLSDDNPQIADVDEVYTWLRDETSPERAKFENTIVGQSECFVNKAYVKAHPRFGSLCRHMTDDEQQRFNYEFRRIVQHYETNTVDPELLTFKLPIRDWNRNLTHNEKQSLEQMTEEYYRASTNAHTKFLIER